MFPLFFKNNRGNVPEDLPGLPEPGRNQSIVSEDGGNTFFSNYQSATQPQQQSNNNSNNVPRMIDGSNSHDSLPSVSVRERSNSIEAGNYVYARRASSPGNRLAALRRQSIGEGAGSATSSFIHNNSNPNMNNNNNNDMVVSSTLSAIDLFAEKPRTGITGALLNVADKTAETISANVMAPLKRTFPTAAQPASESGSSRDSFYDNQPPRRSSVDPHNRLTTNDQAVVVAKPAEVQRTPYDEILNRILGEETVSKLDAPARTALGKIFGLMQGMERNIVEVQELIQDVAANNASRVDFVEISKQMTNFVPQDDFQELLKRVESVERQERGLEQEAQFVSEDYKSLLERVDVMEKTERGLEKEAKFALQDLHDALRRIDAIEQHELEKVKEIVPVSGDYQALLKRIESIERNEKTKLVPDIQSLLKRVEAIDKNEKGDIQGLWKQVEAVEKSAKVDVQSITKRVETLDKSAKAEIQSVLKQVEAVDKHAKAEIANLLQHVESTDKSSKADVQAFGLVMESIERTIKSDIQSLHKQIDTIDKFAKSEIVNVLQQVESVDKASKTEAHSLGLLIESVERTVKNDVQNLLKQIESTDKSAKTDMAKLLERIESTDKNSKSEMVKLSERIESVDKTSKTDAQGLGLLIESIEQTVKSDMQTMTKQMELVHKSALTEVDNVASRVIQTKEEVHNLSKRLESLESSEKGDVQGLFDRIASVEKTGQVNQQEVLKQIDSADQSIKLEFQTVFKRLEAVEKHEKKDYQGLIKRIELVEKNEQGDIQNLVRRFDSTEKNQKSELQNLVARLESMEKGEKNDVDELMKRIESLEKNEKMREQQSTTEFEKLTRRMDSLESSVRNNLASILKMTQQQHEQHIQAQAQAQPKQQQQQQPQQPQQQGIPGNFDVIVNSIVEMRMKSLAEGLREDVMRQVQGMIKSSIPTVPRPTELAEQVKTYIHADIVKDVNKICETRFNDFSSRVEAPLNNQMDTLKDSQRRLRDQLHEEIELLKDRVSGHEVQFVSQEGLVSALRIKTAEKHVDDRVPALEANVADLGARIGKLKNEFVSKTERMQLDIDARAYKQDLEVVRTEMVTKMDSFTESTPTGSPRLRISTNVSESNHAGNNAAPVIKKSSSKLSTHYYEMPTSSTSRSSNKFVSAAATYEEVEKVIEDKIQSLERTVIENVMGALATNETKPLPSPNELRSPETLFAKSHTLLKSNSTTSTAKQGISGNVLAALSVANVPEANNNAHVSAQVNDLAKDIKSLVAKERVLEHSVDSLRDELHALSRTVAINATITAAAASTASAAHQKADHQQHQQQQQQQQQQQEHPQLSRAGSRLPRAVSFTGSPTSKLDEENKELLKKLSADVDAVRREVKVYSTAYNTVEERLDQNMQLVDSLRTELKTVSRKATIEAHAQSSSTASALETEFVRKEMVRVEDQLGVFRKKLEQFKDQYSSFQLETWSSLGRVTELENRLQKLDSNLFSLNSDVSKTLSTDHQLKNNVEDLVNALHKLEKEVKNSEEAQRKNTTQLSNFTKTSKQVDSLSQTVTALTDQLAKLDHQVKLVQEDTGVLEGALDNSIFENNQASLNMASANKRRRFLDASQVQEIVNDTLSRQVAKINKALSGKVDQVVLEELMRHVATRDELTKWLEKKIEKKNLAEVTDKALRIVEQKVVSLLKKDMATDRIVERTVHKLIEEVKSGAVHEMESLIRDSMDENIRDKMTELGHELDFKMNTLKKDVIQLLDITDGKRKMEENNVLRHTLETKLKKELRKALELHVKNLQHITQQRLEETHIVVNQRIDNMRGVMDDTLQKQMDAIARITAPNYPVTGDDLEVATKNLVRDFDEKLIMLCADLSECKSAVQKSLNQPMNHYAQFIWKSGQLKLGSAVPWNYQTVNTDPDNIRWENDSTNIRVVEAGLYEITFAFFTKSKPSIQLVVNGESVMSAINSSSYVVHHGSGFVYNEGKLEAGTVTGLSLLDFLALPAKSTISIHYHGVKKQPYGHGFLGLRKLS